MLTGVTGPDIIEVTHSDFGDRREVATHMPTYVELAILARARYAPSFTPRFQLPALPKC